MRVTCPSCQAAYNIDEQRIPPGGAKLKCSRCQTLIPVRAGAPQEPPAGIRFQEGSVPLPGLGAPSAPPPPPRTAVPPPPSAGGVVPLPSLGLPGLPRLTPAAPEGRPVVQSFTTGAIPLPPTTPLPGPAPAPVAPLLPPRRSEQTVVSMPPLPDMARVGLPPPMRPPPPRLPTAQVPSPLVNLAPPPEEADFDLEPPKDTFPEPAAPPERPPSEEPAATADDGGWGVAAPRPRFGEVDLALDGTLTATLSAPGLF